MGNRIEDFAGTEEEYVKFLEQKVHKLVAHHHKCTLTRPTWGPGIDTVRTTNLDCTSPASTLTFVPWNEHVRSKNRRRETPEWQHKADILVQKTQQFQHSAEWNAVCEAMCTDQAAAFLIDENYTTPHPSNVPTSALQAHRTDTVDVIELLRMYAQNTIKRGAAASMATMFASFQKFILLSSCAVLYYSKSSMEVLDIVRICIGSDATERYCVQVLNTTKYIHRLVDTLNSHGWGTRASVLLLVCPAYPFYTSQHGD